MQATEPLPTTKRYLLVEDDPNHAELVRLAFSFCRSGWELDHVNDGAKAVAFLRREGEYAEAPRPDLILLDLKLPKLSGHHVLEALKGDPETASIPIVVLTTSASSEDRDKALDLHANSYVVKPLSLDDFNRMAKDLDDFWSRWHEGSDDNAGR